MDGDALLSRTQKPSPEHFAWPTQGWEPPLCILGAPWAGASQKGWRGEGGDEQTEAVCIYAQSTVQVAGRDPSPVADSLGPRGRNLGPACRQPHTGQRSDQHLPGNCDGRVRRTCLGTERNADTQRLLVQREKGDFLES